MAIGTITKGASPHDFTVGNKQFRIRDIQLTSGANYVAGGTAITAKTLGMNVINAVIDGGLALSADGTTSRAVGWKVASDGLSVSFYVHTTASAEAAGNADLSGYTVRATFIGRR